MDIGDYNVNVTKRTEWFWVVGLHEGKPVLLGPRTTEDSANELGMQEFSDGFEVVKLNTRNENKATHLMRGKKVKEGLGVGKALERTLHKVPGSITTDDDDL